MSDNRSWVYWDADVNAYVYRASSLGSCIRSLTAARLGEDAFPFHSTIRAAMDASSGLEDEIIRRFKIEMASDEVIWQQKEVEIPFKWVNTPGFPKPGEPLKVLVGGHKVAGPPDVIVRGHLDGLYQLDDSVIEVKALGDANWEKYMAWGSANILLGLDNLGSLGDKYRIQMGIYGHATERKVRLVVGHKVKKVTNIYVDPEEYEWVIDEVDISPAMDPSDLYSLSDLHARIQFIEECAAKDELPECDSNCREGDPYSECHIFEGPTIAEERLAELIRSYDAARNSEQAMKELKESYRETIISEYGIGKYIAGQYSARVEHVKPTQRVDSKKLKKSYPDIWEECSTWGAPTIRLTVTGGDKRDADS